MSFSWATRPGHRPPTRSEVAQGLSPSLLFDKWHLYDPERKRTGEPIPNTIDYRADEARIEHFDLVAEAAGRALRSAGYAEAHGRYLESLRALGAETDPDSAVEATTLWRLVVGFATNPALETGLTLHPTLGVPYVPGSAVKGLCHHVAELELASDRGQFPWLPDAGATDPPDPVVDDLDQIRGFARRAELIRCLFGSLTLERGTEGDGKAPIGPVTPRSLLEKSLPHWEERFGTRSEAPDVRRLVRHLLDEHTMGAACFYDALPTPGQMGDLLQADVLTPHYPKYYQEEGAHPPSDDQDPNPITFLAVAPGVRFLFPFRLRAPEALAELAGDGAARTLVRRWLAAGLREWGAGAKTAAGYGYFEVAGPEPAARTP